MMTRAQLMAKCKAAHPDWTPAQCTAWVNKQLTEDAKDGGADDAKEMAANSNSIKGVEIFAAGTHNGDEYTQQDLDDMVAAFSSLDFRPAIKVGHTKDKPGSPAYGWVTNLKRVGEKLYADFESMHDSVVEAIRNKSYDRVSSEVYFNLKRGAKTFRRALKAVALLGAEVPAVAGLTPLHKMEFAESGFEGVHACEQELHVSTDALVATLSERVAGLVQLFTYKETEMETIKELQEKIAQLTAQIEALKKGDDKDKAAKIVALSEQVAELGVKIAALAKQDTDGAAARDKADKEKDARIAQLEARDRANQVKERASALTVPAFASAITALYAYALLNEGTKVKTYAKDKDGKVVEAEKTLAEITDEFVAQINSQATKLFQSLTKGNDGKREAGETDEDASKELDVRTHKWMIEHKVKSYEEAMNAVLASDSELQRRYAEQTATRAASH